MQAIPYLVAAREQGQESETARTLFAQAVRELPMASLRVATTFQAVAFRDDSLVVQARSADGSRLEWDVERSTSSVLPARGEVLDYLGLGSADDVRAKEDDGAMNRARQRAVVHAIEDPSAAERYTALSSDRRRLARVSGRIAQVWDVASGEALTGPLEHAGSLRSIAFSSDGSRLVTASDDGVLTVWDLARRDATAFAHRASLEVWRRLARCAPFTLVEGDLAVNSQQALLCR
jgi:WD40 repeat protein